MVVGWLWGRRVQRASVQAGRSIGDPALAEFLGWGSPSDAGVSVTEKNALGLTAVWRAVQVTSSTVASLPLKSYRDTGTGRVQVASVFDNPGGDFFTPFEFKQLVMAHLLLHGGAPLLHVYNGAGTLAGFFPLHPKMVAVERDRYTGERFFRVQVDNESKLYTEADVTYVMGLSVDGIKGLSAIDYLRNPLGTAIQGERAAARQFANGAMLGGLVSSDDDLDEAQAEALVAGLKSKISGTRNAGDIAFVNASLKFSPWTMTAEDAQFLESRQFSLAEVARAFGIPVQMLMADGASSWGSGISELVRGWQKFTLTQWTTPIEERLSRVLASPRFVEFELKGLLSGSPAEEVELLLQQHAAGVLTTDEVRAILNLAPLPAAEEPTMEESNGGSL